MPTYYRPGERKNIKHWIARGRIQGEEHEHTARQAKSRRDAQRSWERYKVAIIAANGGPQVGGKTFGDAYVLYRATGGRSPNQIRYIERMLPELEHLPLDGITTGILHRLAIGLYPGAANSTRNRQVLVPARAVINKAAESEWCSHIRVRKLPEVKPAKRRPAKGTEELLLENTEGYQRLYLMMIFRQGWRMSETINLNWSDIDLQRREFSLYIPKSKTTKPVPMHNDVFELLVNIEVKEGPVFPWAHPSSVNEWLTRLRKRLGVKFTSHMARHEWASARNQDGFTPSDMVQAGSWTSPASLSSYLDVDMDHAKNVLHRRRGAVA